MGLFGLGAKKRRILVVDDDPAARALLRDVFEAHFDVEEAADGDEAVRTASQAQPDLVFLDVSMPGLPALQVVQTLRAMKSMQKARIVMTTGFGSLDMVDRFLQAGADDYVTKPVNLPALRAKVEKLLA